MTNQELQRLVEKVSLSFFEKPFLHQATFNQRLKTTGGRYHLSSGNLDFNPLVLSLHGMEELIGVIKHELCHYHLHLEGKGYQHKDADFKLLLKSTGGSRFVKPLKQRKMHHHYRCASCSQDIYRQRRIDTKRYVCKCGGVLKHLTN
ncbi:MAG: SprT family protein [Vagococcus sp.]|uniref:SprT family protein n=1 Tax=Vagococcus TaxID=2737 RepID=UPI002FC66F24